MSLSWGAKAEIKEEILESMAEDRAAIKRGKRELSESLADFDSRKKIAQAELDTRTAIFETSKATEASKKELEAAQEAISRAQQDASYRNRTVDVDIRERQVMAREAEVENKLQQQAMNHAAQLEVVRMEEQKTAGEANFALRGEVETHKASSVSKDAIISSHKEEIERWKEMCQVLSGKLTQVDLKGITIHVEAAKPAGKLDNSENKS